MVLIIFFNVDVTAILLSAGLRVAAGQFDTQRTLGDIILSPCFRVDVVPVHMVHQAVLVVVKRLVSPVDEHAAAGLVVHAAVAVTSLDHRASGRHDLPRVRP